MQLERPGLTVDALPDEVLEQTILSKVLPRESWEELRKGGV